uniref:Uncharacterized protein n=1 Tax=Sphaerodactylus townsendi TaxID=933632 RepID=A0ACB8F035_9SAUR
MKYQHDTTSYAGLMYFDTGEYDLEEEIISGKNYVKYYYTIEIITSTLCYSSITSEIFFCAKLVISPHVISFLLCFWLYPSNNPLITHYSKCCKLRSREERNNWKTTAREREKERKGSMSKLRSRNRVALLFYYFDSSSRCVSLLSW